MGKVLVILMIVLGVWIGMEIFTKGTDSAFGGIFAPGGAAEGIHAPTNAAGEARGAPHQTPVQRIGARVQRDIVAGARHASGGEADEEMDADDDGGSDEFGSEE